MTQPDDEEEPQPTLTEYVESAESDSDDVEAGQATLGEFAGEDPPESDVAALETRLDALEADQEATVELIEQVTESVERLSDLAEGEQHQPPTHTSPRGFY